ncbi:hypothetical protein [Lutibacter sp.]|uniref:hypothetical protein n=1 Tax=Lutibacter sp. TaxID=1925666 RepID=UPI003566B104
MNNKIQEPLYINNTADIDIILAVAFNENFAYSDFTKCRLEGGMNRETVIEEMRKATILNYEMIILSSRNYSDSFEGKRIKAMYNVKVLDKLASSKQRFSRFKKEIIDTHNFHHQTEILEEFMLDCANESIHYKTVEKPIKEFDTYEKDNKIQDERIEDWYDMRQLTELNLKLSRQQISSLNYHQILQKSKEQIQDKTNNFIKKEEEKADLSFSIIIVLLALIILIIGLIQNNN